MGAVSRGESGFDDFDNNILIIIITMIRIIISKPVRRVLYGAVFGDYLIRRMINPNHLIIRNRNLDENLLR